MLHIFIYQDIKTRDITTYSLNYWKIFYFTLVGRKNILLQYSICFTTTPQKIILLQIFLTLFPKFILKYFVWYNLKSLSHHCLICCLAFTFNGLFPHATKTSLLLRDFKHPCILITWFFCRYFSSFLCTRCDSVL